MSKKRARATAASEAAKGDGVATDRSPVVPQRGKIDFTLSIRQRDDLSPRHQQLLDLLLDKDSRIIFVSGPAGTAKTFVSVLAGLTLVNKRSVSDIAYVRSAVESASKSLGFLPGEAGDKMEPFLRPLREKLDEMLPTGEVNQLVKDKRVEGIPVGYLRGASFNARFILVDEAQNLTQKELLTVLTRIGRFSKLVIIGDPGQSDINGHSGFAPFTRLFDDEESRTNGVFVFTLTKADIVRSDTARFVVDKVERGMAKPAN